MKKETLFVLRIIVGVIAVFYLGAMFNFLPFLGNELIVREIGFCTLIVCAVLAICTCVILRALSAVRSKSEQTDTAEK